VRAAYRRETPSVKIGVISKKDAYWSTRQLLKAVERHGHEPSYIRTDAVRLVVADRDDAQCNGASIRDHAIFIPRIGRSMTDFGKMLLRQLELMGLKTTLSSEALITARNKFLALQSLREARVPIPRSILLASRPDVLEAAHFVHYPAILKILSGTQGIGVMRVKSYEETASIVDTMKSFGQVMLLQEYIPNPGIDIRAFVVGDQVIGAMKRVAQMHEWRSNIHLGAKGVAMELDDHARGVAVRASRAVGLEISGVDMIFRGDEPVVLEVNASPGFRGLLQATQINAADAMVDYAVAKASSGTKAT
jgi:ribosomal protein S6--L-glutamate ligase